MAFAWDIWFRRRRHEEIRGRRDFYFKRWSSTLRVLGRDGDVAHQGRLRKVLGKFEDSRSMTTDLYTGSQSKSLPCTAKICTPTQHYSAHVYADGAARWHAQLHMYALVLGYIPVDIDSSTYTMPGLQYFSITSIFSLICNSSDIVKDMCRRCNIDPQKRTCASRPIEWATNHRFRSTRLEVMSPQRYAFSNSIKFHKHAFSTKPPPAIAVEVALAYDIRMHNYFWRRFVWDRFRRNRP